MCSSSLCSLHVQVWFNELWFGLYLLKRQHVKWQLQRLLVYMRRRNSRFKRVYASLTEGRSGVVEVGVCMVIVTFPLLEFAVSLNCMFWWTGTEKNLRTRPSIQLGVRGCALCCCFFFFEVFFFYYSNLPLHLPVTATSRLPKSLTEN